MRRRDFITLVGGAAAAPALLCPPAARAQQAERMRRIGVLVSGAEADPEMQARLAGFREGLQRLGWSEGRNVRVDQRFAAASAEQARVFAKELVATQCDVLVALSTAMAAALQRETRTMPIVFVGLPDPIGSGLVASLARPGGNATGLLLYEESVAGKWLAMLKEIAPRLARVAILGNPKTNTPYYLRAAQAIAPPLGIELVPSDVETAVDIERAIDSFAQVPDGGLMVPPDLTAVLHRDLIIALAARHRLPAVYQARFWVAAGGLMSYGTDRTAAFRQSAYYVDRILRGAQPTDLPVQAPTKFEAKALGLTLPPAMLVAADEVIE